MEIGYFNDEIKKNTGLIMFDELQTHQILHHLKLHFFDFLNGSNAFFS